MLDEIYHAIDPIAFQLGPFTVRWYGIGYIVGILIGVIVLYRTAKRWGIKFNTDNLLTVILAATLGIIVGGRVGFILFYNLEYYLANPLQVFALTNGGMSFHGGLLGMIVAVAIAARCIKMPFLSLCDLVAIGAPIGLFLVRFANFINGELWGSPTDLPWGVVFDGAGALPRHPTQLYEALLEGVVLFIVLFVLSRRVPPRPRGFFVGLFMLLYGIFRIAVEFVRLPDTQIGYLLGTDWLTMGMVLSLPMVCLGIIALIFVWRTRLPQGGCLSDAVEGASEGEGEGVGGGEIEDEGKGEVVDAAADEVVQDGASEGEALVEEPNEVASEGEGESEALAEEPNENSCEELPDDTSEAAGEDTGEVAGEDTSEVSSEDSADVPIEDLPIVPVED